MTTEQRLSDVLVEQQGEEWEQAWHDSSATWSILGLVLVMSHYVANVDNVADIHEPTWQDWSNDMSGSSCSAVVRQTVPKKLFSPLGSSVDQDLYEIMNLDIRRNLILLFFHHKKAEKVYF